MDSDCAQEVGVNTEGVRLLRVQRQPTSVKSSLRDAIRADL